MTGTKLTEGKIDAIVSVLIVNRDSAELMIKRGVDPLEVVAIAQLAKLALAHGLRSASATRRRHQGSKR